MQEPPPVQNDPKQPTGEPMSLTARLFNVFATPGEVFEYVARSGPSPGNWLVPALLISVVGVVLSWLVLAQPNIQQQIREITSQAIEQQIAKGKIPPSQVEQAERYGGIGLKIVMYGKPPFSGFVMTFFYGLLIWMLGKLVFKVNFTYLKAVEAGGLAAMITLLNILVTHLLVLITGNLFASPSLALLFLSEFNPQNPAHASLEATTNVMVLWAFALRALGLAKLAGVAYWKAAVWVFGLWAGWKLVTTLLGFAVRSITG